MKADGRMYPGFGMSSGRAFVYGGILAAGHGFVRVL